TIVGRIVYSEYETSDCSARVPRSMSRVMPPVCRSRWKRRLSECRWRKVSSAIWREAPCVALAKISSRSSVNRLVDRRSAACEAETDDKGNFRIEGVMPGMRIDLIVEKVGYADAVYVKPGDKVVHVGDVKLIGKE